MQNNYDLRPPVNVNGLDDQVATFNLIILIMLNLIKLN